MTDREKELRITGESDEFSLSRRRFLAGLAAIIWTVHGINEAHDMIANHQRKQRERAYSLKEGEQIANTVKEGMADNWRRVSVWPGLAIVPSTVKLYSTPTLHQDTEIKWPGHDDAKKLAAQRPFMVSASMGRNGHNQFAYEVGPEVMGTWLPGSQQIVFFDRSDNANKIILPSHSDAKVYDSTYQVVSGEDVTLHASVEADGLTWRFLEVSGDPEHKLDYDVPSIKKVCGRSEWVNLAQQAAAIHVFESGYGSIVHLPELITS